MSNGKTHLLVGSIVSVVVLTGLHFYFKIFPSITEIVLLPFILYGASQFPDLDSSSSTIRNVAEKILFAILFLLGMVLVVNFYYPQSWISEKPFIFLITTISLVGLIIEFLTHRGWMHNFFTGILFSIPWLLISPFVSLAFFTGFTTHIIMDLVTTK